MLLMKISVLTLKENNNTAFKLNTGYRIEFSCLYIPHWLFVAMKFR